MIQFVDAGPKLFLKANGPNALREISKYYMNEIITARRSDNSQSSESLKRNFDALDSCVMILETIIEDGTFFYFNL